jgi:hypothetical protein
MRCYWSSTAKTRPGQRQQALNDGVGPQPHPPAGAAEPCVQIPQQPQQPSVHERDRCQVEDDLGVVRPAQRFKRRFELGDVRDVELSPQRDNEPARHRTCPFVAASPDLHPLPAPNQRTSFPRRGRGTTRRDVAQR